MDGYIIWASLATCVALLLGIVNIKQYKDRIASEEYEEDLETKRNDRLWEYRSKFISLLEDADTLGELYILHIQIWGSGIRPYNIGPDQYGMFRTDDILTMSPKEVWLGNICGLFTKSLVFWEENKESDPGAYKAVVAQYKTLLLSNLKAYSPGQA